MLRPSSFLTSKADRGAPEPSPTLWWLSFHILSIYIYLASAILNWRIARPSTSASILLQPKCKAFLRWIAFESPSPTASPIHSEIFPCLSGLTLSLFPGLPSVEGGWWVRHMRPSYESKRFFPHPGVQWKKIAGRAGVKKHDEFKWILYVCVCVCPESKQYSRVRFRTVTQAGNMWQMHANARYCCLPNVWWFCRMCDQSARPNYIIDSNRGPNLSEWWGLPGSTSTESFTALRHCAASCCRKPGALATVFAIVLPTLFLLDNGFSVCHMTHFLDAPTSYKGVAISLSVSVASPASPLSWFKLKPSKVPILFAH